MNSLIVGLRRLVHVGLLLILLTPLLVWQQSLFPQLTPKVLAFQILIEIVCAAAIASILIQDPASLKKFWKSGSPVIIALAAFLAYSLLSAAVGDDFQRSLWGLIDRQDGLVLLLHFFAYVVVLAWFYSTASGSKTRFERYLSFSYWVSVSIGLLGVWEWWSVKTTGAAPPLLAGTTTPGRLSTVFGSPLAVGPYLTFHFFFGLYYLWTAATQPHRAENKAKGKIQHPRSRQPRILKAMVILGAEALLCAVTFAGQSRGVVLGLLAGLLFTAALFVFSRFTGRVVKAAGALVILGMLVGAAAIWHFRDSRFVSESTLLSRLTRISLTQDETQTISPRLMTWRSALQGFAEHPLLGWGHDNVYYALNEYYNPRHAQFVEDFTVSSRLTWYDKSHNAYVDLLVEKGIIGAILFLALAGTIGLSLWKMEDRILAFCLAGGFAAYGASNFVAFDSFGPLFGLFLFIAAAVVGTGKATETTKALRRGAAQRKQTTKALRLEDTLRILAGGAVLALAAWGIYLNVEIARAISGYYRARIAAVAGERNAMLLYQDAFKHFSPYAAREKLECAYAAVSNLVALEKPSHLQETLDFVGELARESTSAHPNDVRTYMILTDINNALASYIDPKFAADAVAAGKKAVELSPRRQEVMLLLARSYLIAKQPTHAVELNRKAVAEYPEFRLAHWYLGLALAADNQKDEAIKEIRRAMELGYKLQNSEEEEAVRRLFGEARH